MHVICFWKDLLGRGACWYLIGHVVVVVAVVIVVIVVVFLLVSWCFCIAAGRKW
jgi:hypothetical protein